MFCDLIEKMVKGDVFARNDGVARSFSELFLVEGEEERSDKFCLFYIRGRGLSVGPAVNRDRYEPRRLWCS